MDRNEPTQTYFRLSFPTINCILDLVHFLTRLNSQMSYKIGKWRFSYREKNQNPSGKDTTSEKTAQYQTKLYSLASQCKRNLFNLGCFENTSDFHFGLTAKTRVKASFGKNNLFISSFNKCERVGWIRRMLDGLPLAPDGQGCMSVPPWAVVVHATPCIVSAQHFRAPITREKRYTYGVLRCVSDRVKDHSTKKKIPFRT